MIQGCLNHIKLHILVPFCALMSSFEFIFCLTIFIPVLFFNSGDYLKNQRKKIKNEEKNFNPEVLTLYVELLLYIDPFPPVSDQDRISPYNINTMSTR